MSSVLDFVLVVIRTRPERISRKRTASSRDYLIRIPYLNRDTDMQYLKAFLAPFFVQLAVTLIANAVTAPPPPVSVSVPMVIIHITR
jgi:hypothetical protein